MGFKEWVLSHEDDGMNPQLSYIRIRVSEDTEMPETFASEKDLVAYLQSRGAHRNAIHMARDFWREYERFCFSERVRGPGNPWVD